MDPVRLVENLRRSWRARSSALDVPRRMLWTYAGSLPGILRRRSWDISFDYEAPIGHVRLTVRDNRGSDAFIHGEVFEHEYYRWSLPFSPTSILDLGANAGFSAIYFARRYPDASIVCVEPVPENFQMLCRNLANNRIECTNFSVAVDREDGFVQMEISDHDYGHRVASGNEGSSRKRIEVQALSVPTLIERAGWRGVDLLKMDIEGHEATVLFERNEWLHRVGALCVEAHHPEMEVQLPALAAEAGFETVERREGIWFLCKPDWKL